MKNMIGTYVMCLIFSTIVLWDSITSPLAGELHIRIMALFIFYISCHCIF